MFTPLGFRNDTIFKKLKKKRKKRKQAELKSNVFCFIVNLMPLSRYKKLETCLSVGFYMCYYRENMIAPIITEN